MTLFYSLKSVRSDLEFGIAEDPAGEISTRRKRRKTAVTDDAVICTNDDYVSKPLVTSTARRSQRITPVELIIREKALLRQEQECQRRVIELDERATSVQRKEVEVSLILSQIAEREAKASLAQLEEHFTCVL